MKPIRILVVEDPQNIEIDFANRLKGLGFELKKLVSSHQEALDYLSDHSVDLVLIDDFLKQEVNGLHLANQIFNQYSIPIIVMMSDHRFKADTPIPFPILFKPANDQQLFHTIHRELNRAIEAPIPAQMNNQDIYVRADYKLNKIRIEDIYYVEAMKDYIMIHTRENTFKVHATIKNIMEHLHLPQFIRIHRSFIVNRDKIASIKFPELVVEDKLKTLTIGGLYRKELFEQLTIL